MRGVSRGDINWPAIELDYCTGLMAIREIARKHQVSESSIRTRAKAEGWARDGAAPAEIQPLDPAEIVRRGQDLANRMLDELDVTTAKVSQLRALILEGVATENESARLEALNKVLSLPRRAATLKTLALAAKVMAEAMPARAQGKKAELQAAAENVTGRFAPRTPPKLAVDNTRRDKP